MLLDDGTGEGRKGVKERRNGFMELRGREGGEGKGELREA